MKTWRWMYNRGSRQYIRVERVELTSFHESNKIKTNCWTIINKKVLNLWNNVFYNQRQRRKKTVGGVLLQYNQILYLPGGQPTNLKIIILQRFSHRSKSFECNIRLQSLGSGHGRRSSQTFGFKGQWSLCPRVSQDWGNQWFHPWRNHTFYVHWDPKQSCDSIGA